MIAIINDRKTQKEWLREISREIWRRFREGADFSFEMNRGMREKFQDHPAEIREYEPDGSEEIRIYINRRAGK
jgi:hypothetical protein